MVKIKTPKGLENFIPGGKQYGTLEALKQKYPNFKYLKQVTRKSDNQKFKAGDWVRLPNGEEVMLIAFDKYDYPLPLELLGKPVCSYTSGQILTTVWKSKYKRIIRGIYYHCVDYTFNDLDNYDWLKTN